MLPVSANDVSRMDWSSSPSEMYHSISTAIPLNNSIDFFKELDKNIDVKTRTDEATVH
jgi:hypothetical protein